ncbi:MmcB family DNA repair protein [Bacillus sp. FJAT-52991]|uniref:MmcB family DNA repair protein n=1 Tax=Bacillus kandeliae TaxID=3129297 RepID=A0ABZ2NCL7_9BACI
MKATITGRDPLSLRIMRDLDLGMKVSDVPGNYPVSLDQVKKLSRYRNMLEEARSQLKTELVQRIDLLGIKALSLGPLFRKKDWEGISEVLAFVTEDMQRKELELLIQDLKEKRERIYGFKEASSEEILALEKKEKELQQEKKLMQILQDEAKKQVTMLEGYPAGIRRVLSSLLGLKDGYLVLVKELSTDLIKDLLENGALEYDEAFSVYLVKDLETLVAMITNLRRSGGSVNEDERIDRALSLSEVLQDSQKAMQRIKKEQRDLQAQIESLKRSQTSSYGKMADATNIFSVEELKKYKYLKNKALIWLFERGYVVVEGFTLMNGIKADMIAFDASQIMIVSVKASRNDFMNDQKWKEQLSFCHDFYFLVPDELEELAVDRLVNDKVGIMVETAGEIYIRRHDERLSINVQEEDMLRFAAARELSKRNIVRN